MKCIALVRAVSLLFAFVRSAHADIFQWEYINPADPSQGKRQSTTLAPGGAGVDAVPGVNLSGRNLTMAYLIGVDLTGGTANYANLTDANLRQANLTNASFSRADLTGADFAGAEIRGANFNLPSFASAQLYSTASYNARELTKINLGGNNLSGWNFAGQNLTEAYFGSISLCSNDGPNNSLCYASAGTLLTGANFARANVRGASFDAANLTDADFTGAEVRGASFSRHQVCPRHNCRLEGGITLSQLYSTASYQAKDLSGINLYRNDLAGGNFAGQNLTNARFDDATLTDADFTGADVQGASFGSIYYYGTGITLEQLYSTASYQAHNLSGIHFAGNSLSGGSFVGQNLTNATFTGDTLTDVDFTGADVRRATFRPHPYNGGGGRVTLEQLYSTASYQSLDLSGISLIAHNLAGANFNGQNLTNTNFNAATLTGADFTGAAVRGANFYTYYYGGQAVFGTGLTLAQLYSTASYETHDLSGIIVAYNDLVGGNFVGQKLTSASFGGANLTDADFRDANLTNTSFRGATLTNADFSTANLTNASFLDATLTNTNFTGADSRGAPSLGYYGYFDLSAATTTNLIWPDGYIHGFDLEAGGLLVVRDDDVGSLYDPDAPPIPITVDQHLTMGPGGTLRMVFEADAWDSTISFAPGIPVTRGGILELTFAADVNLGSQVGRTFDLFNWTGVTPSGAFAIFRPYAWDLSNLYTTGQVTLISIPEPTSLALAAAGAVGFAIYRRRKIT
jgi:uncharacterized protein YjbI with pentapeptide repeats